jgi:hypothetical protein
MGRLIDKNSRLNNRSTGWWESLHLSQTNNCTMPPIQRQHWGGAALFSINKVIDRGIDDLRLGCWCWSKYRGRNNHTLRIFCAYCPNPPTGHFSVYAQHETFFHLSSDSRCPRQTFIDDLSYALKQALDKEEHIVVLLDGNHDMRNSALSQRFSSINLMEPILHRHGIHGPSTFRRNGSRTPIDGIWISNNLTVQGCGYLEYHQFLLNADHRCLWLNLTYTQDFGHNMPATVKPRHRRLHCHDPRIISNYVARYEMLAKKNKLQDKVIALYSSLSYPLSASLQEEYESLDALHCEITRAAEKKCRKLWKGQVAFSPKIRSAHKRLKALTLLQKRAKGKKVSSRLLSRSVKEANLPAS